MVYVAAKVRSHAKGQKQIFRNLGQQSGKHDQQSLQTLALAKRDVKVRLTIGFQVKCTHYVKV